MQGGAAHQLHIEVAQTERTLGRLTNGSEGFRHDLIEGFAVVDAFLELGGLAFELLVIEGRNLVFQRIGRLGDVLEFLDLSAFAHTQGFVNDIYHNHSLGVCVFP